MSIRAVKSISQSQLTLEGAGVKLRRAFGFGRTSDFDPFLLLDDFRNEHPEDYLPGFPWHPHRGIETITYVLSGSVQHGDSLGNRGTMGAGEIAATFSHAWQTTTRHLQVLERAGLLSCEKKGRMRIYRIERKRLELVKDWLDHFFRKP